MTEFRYESFRVENMGEQRVAVCEKCGMIILQKYGKLDSMKRMLEFHSNNSETCY